MEKNSEKALRVGGFVGVVLLVLTTAYFYFFSHTEDLDGGIDLNEYGEMDGMVTLLAFSAINIFLYLLYAVAVNLQMELSDRGSVLKYALNSIVCVFITLALFSIFLLTVIWEDIYEYTQIVPLAIYILSVICTAFLMIGKERAEDLSV